MGPFYEYVSFTSQSFQWENCRVALNYILSFVVVAVMLGALVWLSKVSCPPGMSRVEGTVGQDWIDLCVEDGALK